MKQGDPSCAKVDCSKHCPGSLSRKESAHSLSWVCCWLLAITHQFSLGFAREMLKTAILPIILPPAGDKMHPKTRWYAIWRAGLPSPNQNIPREPFQTHGSPWACLGFCCYYIAAQILPWPDSASLPAHTNIDPDSNTSRPFCRLDSPQSQSVGNLTHTIYVYIHCSPCRWRFSERLLL